MLRVASFVALVLVAASLAGCASPDESTTTTPTQSVGQTTTTTLPTTTTTIPTITLPTGTPDDDLVVPWGAYRFDETVRPRSGGSGKIQSYEYSHTMENDGEVTSFDVKVDVLGVSTETVRGQQLDLSTGQTTVVSAPVEVAKLRHTITVIKDDSGDTSPGDTGVATLWLPTEARTASVTMLWQFVHLDFEENGVTGVWENLPTDATQASFSVPYTEGEDPTNWWGFEDLVTTYALSWWAAIFEDATIEEGSHNFGGFQYSADRDTLSVDGYSFAGWRVEWSVTSGADSGGYTIVVAPALPIPFEHSFRTSSSGGSGSYSYKLTGLSLG